MLRNLRKCGAEQTDECNLPDCEDSTAVMMARFGLTSFPCEHTVNSWHGPVPDLPAIAAHTPAHSQSVHVTSLNPDKLKGFGKGFLTSLAIKERLKKKRKKTRIETGDDECRRLLGWEAPDKATEIPEYAFLRDVIDGMRQLRNRKGSRLPRLDVYHRAHDVMEDFAAKCAHDNWGTKNDVEKMEFRSDFAAAWWEWAANGGEVPSGHPDEKA